jgi:hypothetical protein
VIFPSFFLIHRKGEIVANLLGVQFIVVIFHSNSRNGNSLEISGSQKGGQSNNLIFALLSGTQDRAGSLIIHFDVADVVDSGINGQEIATLLLYYKSLAKT